MGQALPTMTMTMADFLEWEETQEERHEFWRGEVFAMVGGTHRHNRVLINVAARLNDHLDGTPCQVFADSAKLQLAEGVLYPDVFVTCGKAEAGDETVATDAALVIEVLSPSTKGYDWGDKFAFYRTLPSLREYVLVDPLTRRVEVFVRVEQGNWLLMDQSANRSLMLASIDCALPMDQIFRGVEPPPVRSEHDA